MNDDRDLSARTVAANMTPLQEEFAAFEDRLLARLDEKLATFREQLLTDLVEEILIARGKKPKKTEDEQTSKEGAAKHLFDTPVKDILNKKLW